MTYLVLEGASHFVEGLRFKALLLVTQGKKGLKMRNGTGPEGKSGTGSPCWSTGPFTY